MPVYRSHKGEPTTLEALKEQSTHDLFLFCTEVMGNRGLDRFFHRLLCTFCMDGESITLPKGDYYIPTYRALTMEASVLKELQIPGRFRIDPEDSELIPINERLKKHPTAMDGSFRGIFIRINNPRNKIVLVPRGHLKTTILTVYKTLWHLVRDCADTILIGMNSGLNARNVIRDIQSQFEVNKTFRDCFWEIVPDHIRDAPTSRGKKTYSKDGHVRWQAQMFDVKLSQYHRRLGRREASVAGLGLGGRLVSQHYQRLHVDDPVDEKTVATAEQIKKAIDAYRALQALGIGGMTKNFYVGTPWHYSDTSQWLLDPSQSGFDDISVFIATALDADDQPIYPFVRSGSTHPGFTKKILEIRRRQMGEALFSSQYLMQPVSADNQVFPPSWWGFYDELPSDVPKVTVMTVDPAISESKQGDASAFVVVTIDSLGRWYVRDIIRHKSLGMSGILTCIEELATRYNPELIGIEAVSFQRSVAWALRDKWEREGKPYLAIKEVEPSRSESKEFRIKKIAPKVEAGLVYLPRFNRDVPPTMEYQRPYLPPGFQELVSEGERFPRCIHDDVLDALSQVVELGVVPEVVVAEKPKTIQDEIMDSLLASMRRSDYDPVLGTEW